MIGYTSEDDTAAQIYISMVIPDRVPDSYQPLTVVSELGITIPLGFWTDGSEAILRTRLATLQRGRVLSSE